MSQKKILIPTKNVESWKQFLADPDKHWKDGYSAKSVAESWELYGDIPNEITKALDKSESLAKAELLLAIPEYKVALPGGSTASQNDVFAVLSNDTNLIVATVEAKYRENFGDKTIKEWLKDSSDGKKERISFILNEIGFNTEDYGNLMYQIFHRLASAVIMARKFHAKQAIMIVQSFEENDDLNHFDDFTLFVQAYGKIPSKRIPIELTRIDDLNIYIMWV